MVGHLATQARDLEPLVPSDKLPPVPTEPSLSLTRDSGPEAPAPDIAAKKVSSQLPPEEEGPVLPNMNANQRRLARSIQKGPILQVSAEEKENETPSKPKIPPLVIPQEMPGSEAPPIDLKGTESERARKLKKLYPELPPLPEDLKPVPGPEDKPLTLSDLQSLAAANNPSIRAAAAAAEAVRGAVIQSAAYPNPSIFWEADTVGTAGAGYQGGGFDQVIKGANKIKLAKAAATMDLRNAELAYRKAVSDLATQVRSTYFAVLVALENIKVNRALARFTDRVYRVQVDLVPGGLAAPYEPIQLRPLVLQARLNLIQARNQYIASWKQLAAALGLPNMPPTELAGRVDLPVPVFRYEDVLARVLTQHTDILTAQNTLQKARYSLELAQVTPFPDFDFNFLVQKDYTTPPHLLVYSGRLTIPVPLWDQNKGGIIQARNQLIQATQGPTQAQLQLTNTLADAFGRYTTARHQVQVAQQQIRDQVRAFRGVYERHGQDPNAVGFGDVVTTEQTLSGYIGAYITALGLQWTAVVDVANLLQTDDLFQVSKSLEPMAPVPDLEELTPVPGCRPTWTRPGQPPELAGRVDDQVIQVKAVGPRAAYNPKDALPKKKKKKHRHAHPKHVEPSCDVLTPEPNK
jgi:cobalt-zinc-cadmium efflux system outer membrane protein